ncbi:MAG TPA: ABC transporter transmembrane domain-containing protein, partial [Stenomitos sp.]
MQRELRTLAGLIWRHRRRYAIGVASLLIVDIGNLTVPWLVGRFIDAARAQRLAVVSLWRYAAALLAIAAVVAVFRYLWRMNIFGTARMVEFELRDRLFRHLQRMSARFYQRHSIGDLMAHATNDLQAIRGVLGEGIMAGCDGLIMVTLTLATMAGTIHWKLTLAALVPLPLLILFEWGLGRSIHTRFKAVQAAFGTLSERVQESLSGARVIKAFAQEQAITERFQTDNAAYYDRYMTLTRLNALNDPTITLLGGLSTVIALGYGGVLVLGGELTLGQFVAFNSYLGMLVWPMLAMGWVINLVQRATASMARIQAILEEAPDVSDLPTALAPPSWQGGLEVRNLSFRYAPD